MRAIAAAAVLGALCPRRRPWRIASNGAIRWWRWCAASSRRCRVRATCPTGSPTAMSGSTTISARWRSAGRVPERRCGSSCPRGPRPPAGNPGAQRGRAGARRADLPDRQRNLRGTDTITWVYDAASRRFRSADPVAERADADCGAAMADWARTHDDRPSLSARALRFSGITPFGRSSPVVANMDDPDLVAFDAVEAGGWSGCRPAYIGARSAPDFRVIGQ